VTTATPVAQDASRIRQKETISLLNPGYLTFSSAPKSVSLSMLKRSKIMRVTQRRANEIALDN
jgi:hypothetical protein